MELLDAHAATMDTFGLLVRKVGDGHWRFPTPCRAWKVRDLVNHLVAEQLWAPLLLAGATLDEVGDRFDGDLLGADPRAAWDSAAEGARAAWQAPGALRRTVHISTGLISATEYGWQMTIDLAVHGWDLATALRLANPLDAELAAKLLDVLRPHVDGWQGLGMFDPPVAVSPTADAVTRLVALLGRSPR